MLDRILDSALDWFIYFAGLFVVIVLIGLASWAACGAAAAWRWLTASKSPPVDANAP